MTLARHVVPYSREVEAVATIQRQYRGHLDRRYHFGVLNWVLFNILDNDNENVRERPPLCSVCMIARCADDWCCMLASSVGRVARPLVLLAVAVWLLCPQLHLSRTLAVKSTLVQAEKQPVAVLGPAILPSISPLASPVLAELGLCPGTGDDPVPPFRELLPRFTLWRPWCRLRR